MAAGDVDARLAAAPVVLAAFVDVVTAEPIRSEHPARGALTDVGAVAVATGLCAAAIVLETFVDVVTDEAIPVEPRRATRRRTVQAASIVVVEITVIANLLGVNDRIATKAHYAGDFLAVFIADAAGAQSVCASLIDGIAGVAGLVSVDHAIATAGGRTNALFTAPTDALYGVAAQGAVGTGGTWAAAVEVALFAISNLVVTSWLGRHVYGGGRIGYGHRVRQGTGGVYNGPIQRRHIDRRLCIERWRGHVWRGCILRTPIRGRGRQVGAGAV